MSPGWNDECTASSYAAFARAHPMYRSTSRDLVTRAGVSSASTVVDLCCGTGVTTAEVLSLLPSDGRALSVDGSASMLAEAERQVTDPRVRWIESRAEDLAAVVDAASVDAVVCNSAIWQSDLAATFAAVHQILRPGGRLVFNVGEHFVQLQDSAPQHKPGLFMVATAYAILDHDFVLRPPRFGRSSSTPESLADLIDDAGLSVTSTEVVEYAQTLEQQRDWLLLPVFGDSRFAPLAAEQREDVLAKAYRKLHGTTPPPQRWYVVVATA